MAGVAVAGASSAETPWDWVRFGDLFEIQQGKALSQKARRGVNPRPFLRTANVLWGKLNLRVIDHMDFSIEEAGRYRLKADDLLVCEGGEVGRSAIWAEEIDQCCYQNHIHRCRPAVDDVDPSFYMYWLQYAFLIGNLYLGRANVTTIANLSKSRLAAFDVPHPPLPEQREIARVLRTAQRLREETEQVITATGAVRQSLMHDIFTSRGLRAAEPEDVTEETDLDSWPLRPLEDIALLKAGGTPRRSEPSFWGGDIPFVKIEDITRSDGRLKSTAEFITREGLEHSSAWLVPPSSVLLTMYATIGAAVVNEIPVATNQAILALLPHPDIHPDYLRHALEMYQPRIASLNVQSTQRNVSRSILRSFKIPVPPYDVQAQIAESLGACELKISAERQRRAAIEELFRALLHDLMTARVRMNVQSTGLG